MLLVTGCYVVLYLPSFVQSQIVLPDRQKIYVTYSMHLIFMLNSISNPLIYYFTSADYKRDIKKLFGCKGSAGHG